MNFKIHKTSKSKKVNKLWWKLCEKYTRLILKTRLVWEKEKDKQEVKCLGAMAFEEQARVFVELIIFQALASISISRYLLKKESVLMLCWSMPLKSSTARCLSNTVIKTSRNCWERTLNIAVIKYFQNNTFKKNYHSSDRSRSQPIVLSYCCF